MTHVTVSHVPPGALSTLSVKHVFLIRATVMVSLLCLGLTLCYGFWSRSPQDLSVRNTLVTSGISVHWARGDVIALVRHAERCDRSSLPCLGPSDGITASGAALSRAMGRSITRLGLGQTDIITSPSTRTAQTAFYMFGSGISSQDWLYNCDTRLLDEVVAHKNTRRNLILITHSGCISKIERQQGYGHAPTSDYNSTLFLSMNGQGIPEIQGVLNAQSWEAFLESGAIQP